MLLCLDVGNTHIFGGLFDKNKLKLRFRYATSLLGSADQFGIFLVNIFKFYNLDYTKITAIALSSVAPDCNYTLERCFSQYFQKANYFLLQPGVKTRLNICCKNPDELGADRIANAIGAISRYPNKSLIIIDMGTATTLCAINSKGDYLGGAILPGIRPSMEALKSSTAKLMVVDIEVPSSYLGETTKQSIQSGLYYGHLGALKELVFGFKKEVFQKKEVTIIGTGGFSKLYEKEKALFDELIPDLTIIGLKKAFEDAKSWKNK